MYAAIDPFDGREVSLCEWVPADGLAVAAERLASAGSLTYGEAFSSGSCLYLASPPEHLRSSLEALRRHGLFEGTWPGVIDEPSPATRPPVASVPVRPAPAPPAPPALKPVPPTAAVAPPVPTPSAPLSTAPVASVAPAAPVTLARPDVSAPSRGLLIATLGLGLLAVSLVMWALSLVSQRTALQSSLSERSGELNAATAARAQLTQDLTGARTELGLLLRPRLQRRVMLENRCQRQVHVLVRALAVDGTWVGAWRTFAPNTEAFIAGANGTPLRTPGASFLYFAESADKESRWEGDVPATITEPAPAGVIASNPVKMRRWSSTTANGDYGLALTCSR